MSADQILGAPAGRTLVGDLVEALYAAAGAFRQQGDQIARGAGQSLARWEVLYVIGTAPITVPAVARRLGRTRQSVQRVVDLLVGEGLVVPQPNAGHRRSSLLALTAAGQATLTTINRVARDQHMLVLQEFSPEEIEVLTTTLRRLTSLARRRPDVD
ncbi:MAG: MarR family winged helix-turn-helix transcriptional regulator [Dehalococcoidia bacterium]